MCTWHLHIHNNTIKWINISLHRYRSPASRPAPDNQPAQQKIGMYETIAINQLAPPEANPYDTILKDTTTHASDDTHGYYNNIGHTEAPPGDEHVYCN